MMWLFVRTGYAGGGYDPVLVRGARTKGQYTTAWLADSLVISDSGHSSALRMSHSHTLPLRRGVCFCLRITGNCLRSGEAGDGCNPVLVAG